MKYKLFIFDFDGTIADSRLNIANSVNGALIAKGFNAVPNEAIFPTIGKLPIMDAFRQFYPELDMVTIGELTQIFREQLIINAKKELMIFPKVEPTLRTLHKNGIKLAILTTKSAKVITEITTMLGINELFTVIYGSGMVGGNKPSKGCVEYIWDYLDDEILPSETIMVGDTSVDLETAKNSAIDSVGVTYGIDGNDVKKLGFTYTIDIFDELLKYA